eukprot:m.312980 g.312980  ORF g.312980 m.312980 type:complete len:302 (-) comp20249_c0_seq7:1042-1947(-)
MLHQCTAIIANVFHHGNGVTFPFLLQRIQAVVEADVCACSANSSTAVNNHEAVVTAVLRCPFSHVRCDIDDHLDGVVRVKGVTGRTRDTVVRPRVVPEVLVLPRRLAPVRSWSRRTQRRAHVSVLGLRRCRHDADVPKRQRVPPVGQAWPVPLALPGTLLYQPRDHDNGKRALLPQHAPVVVDRRRLGSHGRNVVLGRLAVGPPDPVGVDVLGGAVVVDKGERHARGGVGQDVHVAVVHLVADHLGDFVFPCQVVIQVCKLHQIHAGDVPRCVRLRFAPRCGLPGCWLYRPLVSVFNLQVL